MIRIAPRRTTEERWPTRRGDTSHTLELAVRDLTRANLLAPNDATIRHALHVHRSSHVTQRAKDKAAYGGVFNSRDGLCLGGGEKRRGGRNTRFIAGEVRGEPDKRRRGPGAHGVPEHVGARAQGSV